MKQSRPTAPVRAPYQSIGAAIDIVLALAAPVGLYLALAWLLGLPSKPDVTWGYMAGGAAAALLTAGVMLIMGESLIEDVVKFVLFAVPFLAVSSMTEPRIWAIVLGAPVGAFIPILARTFSAAPRMFRKRPKSRLP